MDDGDLRVYVLLIVVGLPFAAVLAFTVYRAISDEVTWASRVRRILARDGFTVLRMERRWLTRGPFPDMRLPGQKHSKEWLIRMSAVDREHRLCEGWLRWRSRWPWEPEDRWAVRWDDTPGQAEATARRVAGLSSSVFFAPLFLVIAIVCGTLVHFGALQNLRFAGKQLASRHVPERDGAVKPDTQQPGVFELRCRGGGDAYRIEQIATDQKQEGGVYRWVVVLSLKFQAAPVASGAEGRGLSPGTCAWIDRPLNGLEPHEIRFNAPAIHTTGVPHDVFPEPGTSPTARELEDPTCYWSFFVFNTNNGFLQATKHNRWTAPGGAR